MRRALADIGDIFSSAQKGAQAAALILEDPYFPEVTRRVVRLHELEQKPQRAGQPKPAQVKGIGLKRIVKPLDYYIAYRERPWTGYLALAALLGIPYLLGRASRRCT